MSVKSWLRTSRSVILCTLFLLAGSTVAEAEKKKSAVEENVYAAVESALAGRMLAEHACAVIKTGNVERPFGGKTPIYLVMDYLATHPKTECRTAEQLLEAFLSRSDFDITEEYRSLLPPFAHLIRTNFTYLGGHFSADYISDNVLKMLIGAGARVNTYNKDGSTLMSFAMETDNKYLQSYFVEKGINLRHEDKAGNDDVYKLIADDNLQTLRQAVDKGSVKLSIEALKNDTKDIARYPELYDYLAQKCASAATKYESLKEFRQRFSDRKTLVQGKWEAMAQAESNAAKDAKAIKTVMERYPDLGKITEPRRHAIYQKDVANLNAIYAKALDAARAENFWFKDGEKDVLKFVDDYTTVMPYDPDSKVPLARELADFWVVCHALTDGFSKCIDESREPRWIGCAADYEKQRKAKRIVAGGSKYDLDDFYKEAAPKLNQRWQQLVAYEERMRDVLKAKQLAYKQEMEQIRAEREAREKKEMAEKERERERENAIASNPDVSLSSIGITYKESDWKELGKLLLERFLGVEKGKYKDITFSDETRGTIYQGAGENFYRVDRGIGTSDAKYETETDAIAAEYFYKKYKATREKGRTY